MTIEYVLLHFTVHVLPSLSLNMLIMMHIKSIVGITGTVLTHIVGSIMSIRTGAMYRTTKYFFKYCAYFLIVKSSLSC